MRRKIDFDTLSCKYFANNNSINQYLNEIRRYTKMSIEEEEDLFNRYKSGDKSVKNIIFLRNQRFIYSLAKRYAKTEDEVMDYVGEGNIGLNEAIDKYEPNRGFKFMTFAVWYIRRAMNYYLTDTKNIINRTNNLKIAKKIDKFKQTFYTKEGRYPSETEIMENLKTKHHIDVKSISDVYDISVASISESASSDDSDFTIENETVFNEKTSTDNEYEKDIQKDYAKEIIARLLKTLSVSEVRILSMYFGLNGKVAMSTEDIADEMGIKANAVSNLICSATKKMRQYAMTKSINI